MRNLLMFTLSALVAGISAAADAPKPNIIWIMADDLGFGDLGVYGQTLIQTPRLDQMAAEGMRFTNAYAGASVCAPSRSVLMTGLHQGHTRVQWNPRDRDRSAPDTPLEDSDITVAEVLKAGGYATGLVGKWALGGASTSGAPWNQGFDHFFGYLSQKRAHNHYPAYLVGNGGSRIPLNNSVITGADGSEIARRRNDYAHDRLVADALNWIDGQQEGPFFLYLSLTVPHGNSGFDWLINRLPDGMSDHRERLGMEVPDVGSYATEDWPPPQQGRAAMITRLDAAVGRILDKLEELEIDGRTLVFFTSDNGPGTDGGSDPEFFNAAGPLRGIKPGLYEGGIRVPLIARWPNSVPAGTVSDVVLHFADLLPTAADLAGTEPPEAIDGMSMVPNLLDGTAEGSDRLLYWRGSSTSTAAARWGKWKAVRPSGQAAVELYDLEADPGEQTDLAKWRPGVVANMRAFMDDPEAPENLAPVFTSDFQFRVVENQTAVGTLVAEDSDDAVTGYALSGGADRERFAITPAGELSFIAPPDFESPADVASTTPESDAADNEYVVLVEVASGTGARRKVTSQPIVVQVTDEAETLTVSLVEAASGSEVRALGPGGPVLVPADASERVAMTLRASVSGSPKWLRLALTGPVSATVTVAGPPYALHADGEGVVLEPGRYDVRAASYLDAELRYPYASFSESFDVRRRAPAADLALPALSGVGNQRPYGVWGDGDTLWVSDLADGRVYAYGLRDGERRPGRELDTAAHGNGSPTGLWSDGETVWVGDAAASKAFAYRLSGGRRASRDIELGDAFALDLWSDGGTLWVLDDAGRLRAYSLADGTRRPDLDVVSDAGTVWPTGAWSDGARWLLADAGQPVPEVQVYRDGALSAAEGLALPADNGLPQALWSNGHALWVTDGRTGALHIYELDPPSANASLTLLRLSDVEIGPYVPDRTAYAGETLWAATTVTAHAAAGARLSITPPDADADREGHQVSLDNGDNAIEVTVTAADGAAQRTYAVTVTRDISATPLTGRFTSLPSAHDGSSPVTLRLEFSEPVVLSYLTLRDEAFEVTGGAVQRARRVDGRRDLWDIEVVPDSDEDLTVSLPATSDCSAADAVCTGDGKPFSGGLAATVPGPSSTDGGLDVIGVPQVGETLTAPALEAAGPAVRQWLRDGEAIPGAIGAGHLLTAADAGAAISVRVTRSGLSRVSRRTIPVWGRPGNPPLRKDEDELLGTVVTVGSTRAYPIRLGGYGRTPQASFGSIGEATLAFGGASTELEVALVGELGSFGIGPPPAGLADEEVWAYWDSHRIGPLSPQSSVVEVLSAPTPQPQAEYRRYGDGSSEGVRVALSIRRAVPPLTASLSAPSASVAEGADAAFEVLLNRAAAADVEVSLSVASEGGVLADEAPPSVTVPAGSTVASLALATEDDLLTGGGGTVTVTLLAGDGYKLGETVSATVTVEDDDVAEWVLAARPSELVEGGSASLEAEVTNGVTHAGAVTLGLSVTGDVSASDYELGSVALELPAGEAVVSTTLSALADGEDEDGAEAARIGLTADGAEVASALVSIRDPSSDATLSALALTDVDIGAFDPETTAYAATVPALVWKTTVTAEPSDANAAVVIADASGSTVGTERTSRLLSGANEIAATVTAEDGETERTYAVTVTREAGSAWGERLPERDLPLPGFREPSGLWSDGDVLWVSNWDGIQAYGLADGARRPGRDVAGLSELPSGLWSDGATLWHSDQAGAVRAFRLSDGTRTPAADLPSETLAEAGNGAPAGLWSDAAGLRVVDLSDGRLYGYGADGEPAPGLGLDLRPLREDDDGFPWGLWSDGETALVTWFGQGTLNAFRLSDGSPLPGRDIDLGSHGNDDPRDLWSDGEVLWVTDGLDGKLYAYAVPGLVRPTPSGLLPVVVKSRAMAVPGADPGVPAAIPDPGLRARIAAALGKDGDAVIGIHELAALEALNARGAGVADLSGLEGAVNLEALDLGNNPVADLRVLSRLPRLRVLNLDGTGADPWAIGGLKALTRLSLRGNGIEDLGSLSGLRRLEALDLGRNAVTDLAGLAPLGRLRALRADHNAIAEIAPLAELAALETADLRGNRIEETPPLARLRADVDLGGNPAAEEANR